MALLNDEFELRSFLVKNPSLRLCYVVLHCRTLNKSEWMGREYERDIGWIIDFEGRSP